MDIIEIIEQQRLCPGLFKDYWQITLKQKDSFISLDIKEFSFKMETPQKAVLCHLQLELKVMIQWQINRWEMPECRISFEAGNNVNVSRIAFRTPERIILNGAPEQDYLMYPYKTGIKIPQPAKTLFEEFRRNDTFYGPGEKKRHINIIQSGLHPDTNAEYQTTVEKIAFAHEKFTQRITDDSAVWGRQQTSSYPGGISMTWMDYCNNAEGYYIAAHDENMEKAQLYFEAEKGQNGVKLGVDKIFNRHLDQSSCVFVFGRHAGSWHRGAEIYREFVDSVIPETIAPNSHLTNCPGIITHYDLKWEDGTITHKYKDIPLLSKQAREKGFDTILLGGWNNGGFDNYTLRYKTDTELGTEDDLKNAIREVHQNSGRVMFYLNALSISMDNSSYLELGKAWSVKNIEGKTDCFGDFYLQHPMATLCNSVKEWRENIKANIKYILLELNANGIYLDQIGSCPRDCYDTSHEHAHSWIDNYRILLSEVRDELKAAGKKDYVFFTEYPMDCYRDLMDCFLCYSFWQSANDLCEPAMFRYVFPEIKLVDMVMQKPWMGHHKSLELNFVQEIFCWQFINGLKFWTYCHAPYNEILEPLWDQAFNLYRHAIEYFSEGKYLDDINIADKSPGILAKEFFIPGRGRLFAVWNPTNTKAYISISGLDGKTPYVRDLDNTDNPRNLIPNADKLEISESILTLIEILHPESA